MIAIQPVKLRRWGTWHSDGQTKYVFVVSQGWDYYHDEYTEGDPDLGPDGLAYYALYGHDKDIQHAVSRSPTCLSEAEAVRRAEVLVGKVDWTVEG